MFNMEPVEGRDGVFEEKLQVDRRRMEAMITGGTLHGTSLGLPNANDFFDKVTSLTGAEISWPSRLKIGAKTKKDPYVKILGSPSQIGSARQLICATLQVKRDRVTLKMEVPHGLHSNIIGRAGRGSQAIMRETGCHVHFPDSNKYSENPSKSNQVSISGPPLQVEHARRMVREFSPVCISFDLPWFFPHPPSIPPLNNDLALIIRKTMDSTYCCMIRGTVRQRDLIEETLNKVKRAFHVPTDFPLVVRLSVDIRPQILQTLTHPALSQRVDRMCSTLCVSLHSPPNTEEQSSSSIRLLVGTLTGVLTMNKFIMGLMPISLQFEQTNPFFDEPSSIEHEFPVTVFVKNKNTQNDEQIVVVKSTEEHVVDVLRARQRILGMEQDEHIDDHYAFMKTSPGIEAETEIFSRSIVGRGGMTNDDSSSTVEQRNKHHECARSPDPAASPIAHSLLTGAKHICKNSDLWNLKPNREQMLLKANQAIYDSGESSTRYPTDLWAGYGFSSSLPADLLKGMLDWNKHLEGGNNEEQTQTSVQTKMPAPKGLASVREEEEDFSDLSASSSSLSNRFPSRIFAPARPRVSVFSASTSTFDSPIGNDQLWDIRVFVDPAMVLAQLGCSEYLAQLRDQEIDMHAFLLLDEQALRDVGVSTVGARKKIHHAILKLRESAKAQGYSL